jgi:hypothetical protein
MQANIALLEFFELEMTLKRRLTKVSEKCQGGSVTQTVVCGVQGVHLVTSAQV